MEIIASFNNGLFDVFLKTDKDTFYKFIVVKCGDKKWEYCIYNNFDSYNMIGPFLKDLCSHIQVMDLADGIEGVFNFLNSLLYDEYGYEMFLERYY